MILRISLVFFAGAIAYLSLAPSGTLTVGSDKIGHFIAYFVLMLNAGLIKPPSKTSLLISVIATSLYGVIMEVGQYYVPGRFMSFYDVLANVGGVLVGLIFLLIFHSHLNRILTALGIN